MSEATHNPRSCFFGAYTLRASHGGIAYLARLIGRVLVETAGDEGLTLGGRTVEDYGDSLTEALRLRSARGSRLRYLLGCQAAALRSDYFVYDCVQMAQAHARMPGLRRPFLTFMCGIELWEDAKPRWVESARRADRLLAITHYSLARGERQHGRLPNARVCWLGTEGDESPIDAEGHRPIDQRPPEAVIIARIDADEAYKGHRELIDCWPRVTAAVPEAVLHVVGGGSGLEAMRAHAGRSPAAANIIVHGFVSDDAIQQFYRRCRVFAMPSRGEGFGLVYVEAMRHGLPVIASVHDAAIEVNADGESGYNVNLDRADELPERLIELLGDPGRALEMGESGRRRWRRHFCYSAFKARLSAEFHQFVTGD